MIIPKKLKIGGHQFKVEIKEMKNLFGETDYSKNTISLDSGRSRSQQEVTLIHEILHAINSEMDSNHMGHIVLEGLSQQLYQVLNDNKMLR